MKIITYQRFWVKSPVHKRFSVLLSPWSTLKLALKDERHEGPRNESWLCPDAKHYWSIVDLNIFDSRNLKTMCFYVKFISCLLLVRNFENQTFYVLKRHPIFSVHPVLSEHFWSLKLSKLLFGGSEHLTIPNSQN